LRIVLETKNYEHIEQVKQGLVNAGFRLV
jgi:hypothetical protein